MLINKDRCKQRLAVLWYAGSGIIFSIVLLQTFFGYYGEDLETAWGWALPTILPSLSLIVGILVSDAIREPTVPRQSRKRDTTDPFLFRLAFGLSAAYLAVVLFTILVQPISTLSPPEIMKKSHLWLAPFQGLVSACLGAFFIQQVESKQDTVEESTTDSKYEKIDSVGAPPVRR